MLKGCFITISSYESRDSGGKHKHKAQTKIEHRENKEQEERLERGERKYPLGHTLCLDDVRSKQLGPLLLISLLRDVTYKNKTTQLKHPGADNIPNAPTYQILSVY